MISNTTQAPQEGTQQNLMQMQQPTSQDGKPSDQLVEAIRILFQQWKAWFKNKMKTKDDDFDWSFDMVLVWANYLTKKTITQSEFIKASELSFDEEWMPNNAKEFLALARTAQASPYPTAQSAFTTACQNCGMRGDVKRDWKHEVVYETANRIGWGVLASATEYYFKTFQEIYEQVVSEHRNGASFKVPETHRIENSHAPVQAGSEADKRITAELAELRRMSA